MPCWKSLRTRDSRPAQPAAAAKTGAGASAGAEVEPGRCNSASDLDYLPCHCNCGARRRTPSNRARPRLDCRPHPARRADVPARCGHRLVGGAISCSRRQPYRPGQPAARRWPPRCAAIGIEYAAQAMAVHGALLALATEPPGPPMPTSPRHGYLTSLRGVTLHVARLDDLAGELRVCAERLSRRRPVHPLPIFAQPRRPLPASKGALPSSSTPRR
jgi:hypothetical protein